MLKSLLKFVLTPASNSYRFLSYWYNYTEKGYQPRKIEGLEHILEQLSVALERVDFIQVGSNDGISGDPINFFVDNYNWHGVLVEPIPFLFEQLRSNYARKQEKLQFLNVAVGNGDETNRTIYMFDEKYRGRIPEWYYQLSSFYKEVIYHHDIPDVDNFLVERNVQVRSLQSIIDAYFKNRNIDLLHIDTEGYDFEILKTVDFSETLPKVILVEYIHLDIEDRKRMMRLVKANGYKVYRCNQDYIFLHNSVHDSYIRGTHIFHFWE